jgi:exodeoxyribonuclease VII large subunit
MEDNRQIFTLTDLGKSLRSVIERNYSATYWIKAEIAKLNFYPRSGHCYPELVDKAGNVVQAQMRSTIWATDFNYINKQFLEITGEPLREGIAILFRASVTYHPVYGLSLQIWEIEPSFTLGEMALEKARSLARLKEDGIFDQNKTLTLPLLPKRIAVISVETSKGYHDFMNIIHAHASRYAVWHFLFPTVLQGDKAAEGIISQLRIIRKAMSRFDMVAIIRGGGGDIGLSCYDDFNLSREIALFPLPVITGIGHSTNETISEMVAWANKITPTDVAYFILEKFREFEGRVEIAAETINNRVKVGIENKKNYFRDLEENLFEAIHDKMNAQDDFLRERAHSIAINAAASNRKQSKVLENIAYSLTIRPTKTFLSSHYNVEKQLIKLDGAVKQRMTLKSSILNSMDEKILLLDPVNILGRGYSITTMNGKKLTDVNLLNDGDVIHTRLKTGVVESVVKIKNK